MMEKDAFTRRERWLEEKYFRRHEEELIRKLRQRRELMESTGITDKRLLDDLQELGYSGETVEKLLYLVPLLQVAWSEGFVTERERWRIFEIARRQGVREGTPAYRRLNLWLGQRPPDALFWKSLRIIHHLLGSLPPEEREKRRRDLIAQCLLVASASGSILGWWALVSATEWEILRRIAAELDAGSEASV